MSTHTRLIWFVVTILMPLINPTNGQNLSDAQISLVTQRLAESASHSWEYGTRSEVLLEYNAPSYSVFSSVVPPPSQVPAGMNNSLSDVFAIAHTIAANRSVSNGHVVGPQPLIQDSSAGDPASIGVAVLLANWTGQGASDGLDYAGAAQDQLDFLFWKAPRTHDGAISHRMDQVQLWSDFVYMVPPFLAYYGVVTGNRSLLVEAYAQIRLYRKHLRDGKAHNLWRHIQLGHGTDNGHWSTGNAWAAAGMVRVLATIQKSVYADSLQGQQRDLVRWVREIHDGMYRHVDPSSSLLRNYADNASTFLDASSTALLASTVYRLSVLSGVHTNLARAEKARMALSAGDGEGMQHFTTQGWLTPVVDPYAYGNEGSESPEGQAFVVAMQAAWREWVAEGAQGAGVSVRLTCFGWRALVVSWVVACVHWFA